MFGNIYNTTMLRALMKEVKKIRKINLSDKSHEEILNLFTAEKSKEMPNRVMVFAIISEAFRRTINIDVYDEQLMGGLALDDGFISEMKTGEGKTFVSVFPSVMSSFSGKAYNVTVNDYLAKRDYEKTQPIYEFLGIASSFNEPFHIEANEEKKKEIYKSSVIYTSGSEFVFDYLREETIFPLDCAIIDEIDFVLIDNANSKFSVSRGGYSYVDTEYLNVYEMAKELYKGMTGGYVKNKQQGSVDETRFDVDFVYSPHNRSCALTMRGMEKVEKIFRINSIGNYALLYKALLNTIEANLMTIKDKDYLVEDDKIILINRENGRLMPNSSRGEGLQTAIELKENVKVTAHDDANNSISYQLFFAKFKKLIGMSGTVMEASSEFKTLFKTDSIEIPTHKPNKRIDYPDRYFKTKKEKYEYLKTIIKKIHTPNRPILVITESERESVYVHNIISEIGIEAQVLNALNYRKEEEQIIQEAGSPGRITVSTNMSGRGTDIVLDKVSEEHGGLFVISTNKYESRRIDNQTRGRAGRQGQSGGCLFLSSFEDAIFTHCIKKKYEEYVSMTDDEFYSEKVQERINMLVDSLQRQINSNMEGHRKIMFETESIDDTSKQYIIAKGKEYVNAESLSEFIMSKVEKEFESLKDRIVVEQDEKLLFFYEPIDVFNEINKSEILGSIKEKIDNKINQIGDDVSKKLLETLVKELVKSNWHHMRHELEELSEACHVGKDETGKGYAKYVIEAKELIDAFEIYINVKSIELFLIASPK